MKAVHLLVCVAGCAVAVSQASASLVLNGNFEAGNTDFTSGYEYTSAQYGLASGGEAPHYAGEGKYAVGTDPQYYHSGFVSFGDHTTGTGKMMIVNGSEVAGKNVWPGSILPPLTVGETYVLSAWVRNVYASSPASLKFSVGGVQVGSNFTVTGTDAWHEFSATFVAAASQTPTAVDLNLEWFGNDFALDDISVALVPEPTTIVAGALLLLPFGASTLRILRRNRKA
jgi:hypothetical protein